MKHRVTYDVTFWVRCVEFTSDTCRTGAGQMPLHCTARWFRNLGTEMKYWFYCIVLVFGSMMSDTDSTVIIPDCPPCIVYVKL